MRMRPLLVSITATAGTAYEALYHAQSRLAELRTQMRHLVASAQLQQRQDQHRKAQVAAQPVAGSKKRGKASAAINNSVTASGAKVRVLQIWPVSCCCSFKFGTCYSAATPCKPNVKPRQSDPALWKPAMHSCNAGQRLLNGFLSPRRYY